MDYTRGVPALVNDVHVVEQAVAAVRRQLGEAIAETAPVMGSEDLSYLFERVPGCQLRIGSGAPGRSGKLHNSGYAPDESCIGIGVQALSRAALEMLG